MGITGKRLLFFFIILIQLPLAAVRGEPSSLFMTPYCHEIIFPSRVLSDVQPWKNIIYEVGLSSPEEEGTSTPTVASSCAQRQREELELADFQVDGRRLMRERNERLESRPLMDFRVEGALEVPILGQFRLRPGQVLTNHYEQSSLSAAEVRNGRLWEKLPNGLSQRTSSFQNTLQIIRDVDSQVIEFIN